MKKSLLILGLIAGMTTWVSCSDDSDSAPQVDTELNADILEDFSEYIAQASYNDLKTKAAKLNDDIEELSESRTDVNLTACRTSWKAARQSWELTEAFLFGPVSTANIDPRIDTWPVNFSDLEAQLDSENEFTEGYIDDLEESLKGFHPIEYLIFGQEGDKVAADLTNREIEYLQGLGKNLKMLTAEMADGWDPADNNSFHYDFVEAGSTSAVFDTQQDAFLQIVESMAGICDEVANAKMDEVLKDLNGEESPYSKNSLIDFRNNIQGVLDVYVGKSGDDSLEDLVRTHNLSLDGEIKQAINAAITSLTNLQEEGKTFEEITDSKPTQVQQTIDAINAVEELLSTDLNAFVVQHTK